MEAMSTASAKPLLLNEKAGEVQLIVDKVVVVGLSMTLVMVLLDKATAAQLAPVGVLGGGTEQATQEASGAG